ncbi:ribokinase [Fervidobacterium pennivorans DSM 9078]|uniref:Ribokinase n=1 Tax=Fervidobacterium pennivorans (strain DSM 9078 / Ven5) TaxID=771875 RepID=H9U9W2_FERPD|nr:ribokinase [Fervidobacterium pennivorans]AFG34305.1 ribokinase [Fervidobacterium pennivorans DSM 9078]
MIAIVGSSNIDIVLTVEHFTNPGETQRITKLEYFPGGKGANQAVAIARLSEKPVYFLTAVGDDQYGKILTENYERENIHGYRVVSGISTGMAFIEVCLSGENRIIIYPGANACLTQEMVLDSKEELLKANILLVQNEIPFETTLYACAMFKEASKIVIFDPAPAQDIRPEIFRYVDFLTPNEEELNALSKTFFDNFVSIEDSFEKFNKLGLKAMIVKLGDKGATYVDSNRLFNIPTIKVTAVDTTAAGDVFNGALAVALSEGKDLAEAIRYANICAAISVTRKGAQPSIPKRIEVEEFLKGIQPL